MHLESDSGVRNRFYALILVGKILILERFVMVQCERARAARVGIGVHLASFLCHNPAQFSFDAAAPKVKIINCNNSNGRGEILKIGQKVFLA